MSLLVPTWTASWVSSIGTSQLLRDGLNGKTFLWSDKLLKSPEKIISRKL